MPGKSKHAKKRYSFQSKKKKRKQHFPTTEAAQQQVAAQAMKPDTLPKESVPLASVPTQKIVPAAVKYPFIATELRRIGILGGIIFAILIILALVLPYFS